MTVATIAETAGTVAPYAPSGLALVPDLTPVRTGKPARPDRTCVAPLPGLAGDVGEVVLCGAILGKNGATRRARHGQRFCSDECQRRGQRHERFTETEAYGRMAARIVRSYGRRAATAFDQLGQLAEVARAADEALRVAVAGAREQGLSWTVIGEQFGITRQAAQQRFGK